MKRLLIGLFFFCLLLGTLGALYAESDEAGISAKAEVDRGFVTIGSEIKFRLSINHDPNITVLDTNAYKALTDFEIKSEHEFSYKEGGKIVEGKTYTLTNYELGEYVIHPIEIQYRGKSGETLKLETAKLFITVESVDKSKDTANDIRGVKGVVDLRTSPWLWILFISLILGTALGIFLWNILKKKAEEIAKHPDELLSPQDEACRALSELSHSDLLQRGDLKTYFFRMSEILKRYFERRYQIHTFEQTTKEIIDVLRDKMGGGELTLIKEVLVLCDLVKFAKFSPTPSEILKQNQDAKKIVDQTKETVSEIVLPTGSER